MPDADAETRADRRERYERVLACVAANVHVAPESEGLPGCPRRQVVLSLSAHGPFAPDRVRAALQAGVEQTDLYRWHDAGGKARYTPVAEAALCALTHHVASVGHRNKRQIAADCNHLRQTMSNR